MIVNIAILAGMLLPFAAPDRGESAGAAWRRILDLDVPRGAVAREHRHNATAECAKGLITLSIGTQRAAYDDALSRHPESRSHRDGRTQCTDDASDPTGARRREVEVRTVHDVTP